MPRGRWTNWAGNQHCDARIERPRNLAELKAAVKRAAGEGKRVRATGGSYSWSPLVKTDDVIIDMKHLDGCHVDEAARTVEVQCGMTIRQLTAITAEAGLTLITPTLFPEPTVGGVVATGSHGTNRNRGNFSDQILEMKIVRADGEEQTLDNEHPDFPAHQVALGTLGVIYSVKLKPEELFNVYVDKRYLPVDDVLSGLDDLQKSTEFLEIFWWPQQPKMWLYIMNRTKSDADPTNCVAEWRSDLWNKFLDRMGGNVLPWLSGNLPGLTPLVHKISGHLVNEVAASVRPSNRAFHFLKTYPKAWDLSYAIAATDAVRAWEDGIALLEQYARADRYPMNLVLHCRFTAGSSAWLAPNYGRPTCYIEASTTLRTPEWRDFFAEMESRWIKLEGARPHWGKLYNWGPDLASRYENLPKFLAVRERYDPERTFLNPFLEREVFQPDAPQQVPPRLAVANPWEPLGAPRL